MIANLPAVAAVDVQIEELARLETAYLESHAQQLADHQQALAAYDDQVTDAFNAGKIPEPLRVLCRSQTGWISISRAA
jgi:hypothetical protein